MATAMIITTLKTISTMPIDATPTALLRLMQLSSPGLPVGGYAFSQGMEYAIELGWIKTVADTEQWLAEQLQEMLARVDVPILLRLQRAFREGNYTETERWNQYALACRETKELRLTDTAMGLALWQLLNKIDTSLAEIERPTEVSFPWAFALASQRWNIPAESAALGYLWSWLENQVMAATKLVPLGQTQAQQLLLALQPVAEQALEEAQQLADDDIGSGLPALAIASAGHEQQYSRLFRS